MLHGYSLLNIVFDTRKKVIRTVRIGKKLNQEKP